MRKVMKKIVASLATAAMAVGMFAAVPAQEAKAASVTTKLVVDLSDATGVSEVWLEINNEKGASITTSATAKDAFGWGHDLYKFTKDSNNDNRWYIEVSGEMDIASGQKCVLQAVIGGTQGYKIYLHDLSGYGKESTYYFSCDMTNKNWPDVMGTATTQDPKKVDASGVIAKINEIGTVELKDESLAKITAAETAYKNFIDNGGDKNDVTNYDKLTAARAKYTELQAAEDAKYAGKLTVYVNVKATGWNKVCLYSWDRDKTEFFGAWPGDELTPLKKNVGWYSCSFDITREAKVIFNNGEGGTNNQTEDWEGIKAGTYWITLSEKSERGYYNVDNVSTKAPSDWKDEAAEEKETQAKPQETTTAAPVEKGDVVSKDEAAKIEKEAVVEGKPDDSTFKVTEIAADSDAFKAVREAAKTGIKNRTYVAVDFKLLKGTEAVQPNGDVKITMPVPEKLKSAKQVEVFRMGDDNKLVSLGKVDVTDSKITFTTNHFSTYVFAEVKTATTTGDVAPILALLAVAAVAGAMVVASRKKTVSE